MDVSQILVRIEAQLANIQNVTHDAEKMRLAISDLTREKNALTEADIKNNTKQKKLNKQFADGVITSKSYATQTENLTKSHEKINSALSQTDRALLSLKKQYRQLIAVPKGPGDITPDPKVVDESKESLQGLIFKLIALIGMWHFVRSTLGGVIKSFMEWEYTLSNVYTQLDSNDKQLDAVSIKTMRKYGFAIKDVNKALYDAISALVPAGQAAEFMDSAARLAIGGYTDLKHAVDGLTSVMNTYNLTVEESGRIADAIFRANKFGKTTVEALVDNMGRVLPIAKAANISYQEMLAALAELTLGGLNTEEAVTSLRQAINGLISPAVEAEKALRLLDVPVGVSEVSAVGLRFALLKLTEAYEKAPDAITDMIPNIRAFTGIAALTSERLEHLNIITEDVITNWGEYSSLTYAVDKQLSTMQKRWDILNARIRTNKILLTDFASPLLTGIIDKFHIIGPILTTLGGGLLALSFRLAMFRNAWIALRAAIIATTATLGGWITLVTTALAGLALGIGLYRRNADDLSDSTKELSKALSEELWIMNQLFNQAKARGALFDPQLEKDRTAAMLKLLELYPEYLKDMDLEAMSLQQLTDLQKGLTQAIRDKYEAEMIGAETTAITKQAIDNVTEAVESFIKTVGKYISTPTAKGDVRRVLFGFATGTVDEEELRRTFKEYNLDKIETETRERVTEKDGPIVREYDKLVKTNALDLIVKQLTQLRTEYQLTAKEAQEFFDAYFGKSGTGAPEIASELEKTRQFSEANIDVLKEHFAWRQDIYNSDTERWRKSLMAKELAEYQSLITMKETRDKMALESSKDNNNLFEAELNRLKITRIQEGLTNEQYYEQRIALEKKFGVVSEETFLEQAQKLATARAKVDVALLDEEANLIDQYNFYVKKRLDKEVALTLSQREELEQAILKYHQNILTQTRKFNEDILALNLQYFDTMFSQMPEGEDKVKLQLLYNMSKEILAINTKLNRDLEDLREEYERSAFDEDATTNKEIYEKRKKEYEELARKVIIAIMNGYEYAIKELDLKGFMEDLMFKYAYPTFDMYTIDRSLEEIQNKFLETRKDLVEKWASASGISEMVVPEMKKKINELIFDLREGDVNKEEFLKELGKLVGEESDLWKYLAQTIEDEGAESLEAFEDAKDNAFWVSDNMQEFSEWLTEIQSMLNINAMTADDFAKSLRVKMKELGIKFKPGARKKYKETGVVEENDFEAIPQRLVDAWEDAKSQILDIVSSLANEMANIWAEHDRREFDRMKENLKDQEDTEQEILKNRLDKGLMTEEQYAKRKADLDEKYRRREEAIKRKEFEQEKKRSIALIWINAAVAAIQAFVASGGNYIAGAIQSALILAEAGAMTAITSAQKYAKGGIIGGEAHAQGGTKFFGSDGSAFEAERGELLAIINKKDTNILRALSAINSIHGNSFSKGGLIGSYADGGMLTRQLQSDSDNKALINAIKNLTFIVHVEEIDSALATKNRVKSRATF